MKAFAVWLLALAPAVHATTADYPVQPVPFTAVQLTAGFWKEHQDVNRTLTLPFAFKQCEESGRLHNFDLAAEVMRRRANGEPHFEVTPPTQFPFDDSDAYKAIEAASYVLNTHPDAALAAEVDGWIARIAAAQEPDGYLYTFRTMHPDSPGHKWVGRERWENEARLSHELYDSGHLFEAGCAHFRATGRRTLLDVCLKNADLLWRTFGDGARRVAPGHEVVEMGLAKLYRATGDERYLVLAKRFLDARGPGGPAYNQSTLRVVDQTEAMGHAVRANYLYCGMADVAALLGDARYQRAIVKIWDDVAATKLYLTGGVGARKAGEAYGEAYELPNDAYNETCAAVALMMWSHRMFLLTGEARYMDVFERTAYNGFISGVSLSGDRFFYPNPLAYDGQAKNNSGYAGRAPWFGCACCPPNLMRMLASLSGYFYAVRGEAVYVNLFAASEGRLAVGGTDLGITQATDYPWKGAVTIRLNPAKPARFALKVRVPGWSQGHPVPSDLYSFGPAKRGWSLKINGQPAHPTMADGYAVIERRWSAGETVALDLQLPVETVQGNPRIAATRGKVAFERGPIVYCVEDIGAHLGLGTLAVAGTTVPQVVAEPKLLGGVTVLKLQPAAGALPIEAIPYYAWNNRGLAPMEVWIPSTLRPNPVGGAPLAINLN